ncbi:LpxI family protein [Citreimonas salinaria]|uniref:Phosphatidate cytidylyltransferase n=1 Tax=Citreimonas salinaria TaxID=321339 RepID=A0A1H3GGV1_9RHOB|nr:UDP-2,3-diacylglucosamine diphosphatase LpxI [Citreimonas salinaria]SDY02280.1 hypothetical protein SAMN05444340_102333 [Citreimonas salinaria]
MLALICGAGALPGHVVRALDVRPLVCALDGFAPEGLAPRITFRIETLGSLIAWLKARGVTAVCLCGHIRRPDIDTAAIDAATVPLVPRLKDAMAMGDDGALRVVLALFSEAGFDILAAHEAAPDLLPPAGVPTRAAIPEGVAEAARAGDAEIARLAAADQGQACVIRDGRVIASEGPEGTDAMLAGLAAAGLRAPAFLFKAPKPGQDQRADLPVIGPGTAAALVRTGLSGAVIEAGGVMVLDRARTIADFDAAGQFLWVRERPA